MTTAPCRSSSPPSRSSAIALPAQAAPTPQTSTAPPSWSSLSSFGSGDSTSPTVPAPHVLAERGRALGLGAVFCYGRTKAGHLLPIYRSMQRLPGGAIDWLYTCVGPEIHGTLPGEVVSMLIREGRAVDPADVPRYPVHPTLGPVTADELAKADEIPLSLSVAA